MAKEMWFALTISVVGFAGNWAGFCQDVFGSSQCTARSGCTRPTSLAFASNCALKYGRDKTSCGTCVEEKSVKERGMGKPLPELAAVGVGDGAA